LKVSLHSPFREGVLRLKRHGQVSWLPDHPSFTPSRPALAAGSGSLRKDYPRLQWRDRSGFTPNSLLTLERAPILYLCNYVD